MAITENTEVTETITNAEWCVMRIVWTLDEADSHTIIDLVSQQHDWKAATIKTLIGRLVKKGALATTKNGRQFIYTPLIPEQTAMDAALTGQLDQMCAMCRGQAFVHAIDQTELSQADIQELITHLQEKLATAPTMIACDCLPDGYKGSC
ncbi:CopY/TcrY family copper transport repressor [Levilactobacillus parabrevis]|uniref:Transcriptional regulator n=1 Tax=Levilactobacillus parabrevis ATCC 53295 TaxID=1267003 RepID=A0A0R1GYX6_9LACO|nr:CopY/TcrY family copper transport repressor [Levilactobacillus parabrevis]KRK39374.1 transcriptional regulator [Levilactobacillus parabrevis ATCC 53295]KRO07275.1 transcriptional regulator [Levilactobacillus parabrevis]MCT4487736.1 CopY/TcrY family copper transport repressor [Levilactobacillus parabrevis]MCT4489334.1 CopY/TcrY family copper transport repressor [Levilactobacillus parabrevis]